MGKKVAARLARGSSGSAGQSGAAVQKEPPACGAAVPDGAGGDAACPLDTSKLAHELRTPLGAIMTLSEIMRDERLGPLPHHYREYASHVYDSAKHALNVMNAALQARNASLLSAPLHPVELRLDELIEQLTASLQPLAARNAVRLAADPRAAGVRVEADDRALRQILLNLIANALRFTPPGGQVLVRTLATPTGARLEVVDDGDGMTPRRLAQALQASARPARTDGGSGFGLPIVQALAALCGAAFSLSSSPGHGTTAIVEFPRRA